MENRAYDYKQRENGTYVTDMTNLFWVGNGGLHTNLHDLLLWGKHFLQPKLGKNPSEFIKMMNKPNSQLGSSPNTLYANGQFVTTKNKQTAYSHSGGWLGTFSYYARDPEHLATLMFMCNDVSDPQLFEALKVVRETTAEKFLQP